MKRFKTTPFAIALVVLFLTACAGKHDVLVRYSDSRIAYQGRIDTTTNQSASLFWSGTSIRLNFEGDSVLATFSDQRGDNYYNIIVDTDSLYVLRTDSSRREYLLASGLGKGPHAIEIFKRTEWDRGTTSFHGFRITGQAKVLEPDEPRKRKIEFYGNSITAGYGVEDFSGKDRSDSIFTNNYLSYARLTADHYNAQYSCICKSGIGITISWFPVIMPEIYDRLDPTNPDSHWDFARYTPDVVVINLFQNDSWLVKLPKHEQFKARFGTQAPTPDFIVKAYADFVRSIRAKYPEAHIVCILGNMDITREGSPWPGYVGQAVAQLADPKIYTHFVPFKNTGCHPSIAEQQALAQSLIGFIDAQIKW